MTSWGWTIWYRREGGGLYSDYGSGLKRTQVGDRHPPPLPFTFSRSGDDFFFFVLFVGDNFKHKWE